MADTIWAQGVLRRLGVDVDDFAPGTTVEQIVHAVQYSTYGGFNHEGYSRKDFDELRWALHKLGVEG